MSTGALDVVAEVVTVIDWAELLIEMVLTAGDEVCLPGEETQGKDGEADAKYAN
jgi:hypothetical protein